MATLNSYITEVRRLLHDANANFWTNPELTDYINDARNRVAADTSCSRSLASITLNVQTITGTGDGTTGVITGVSPTPNYSWIGSSIAGTGITGIVSGPKCCWIQSCRSLAFRRTFRRCHRIPVHDRSGLIEQSPCFWIPLVGLIPTRILPANARENRPLFKVCI